MKNEIKPCPYCNGQLLVGESVDYEGLWEAECTRCEYLFAPRHDRGDLINACNKRPSPWISVNDGLPDKSGLYEKFSVIRNDGQSGPGGKHENCEYFVLDLTHDPHARRALNEYSHSCADDKPELARDMQVKLKTLDASTTSVGE